MFDKPKAYIARKIYHDEMNTECGGLYKALEEEAKAPITEGLKLHAVQHICHL